MTTAQTKKDPNDDVSVSLREYVDIRLNGLRDLLEQHINGLEKDLGLQAEDYARRLDILNNAHETMREIQEKFLLKEMYLEYHKALENRVENFVIKESEDIEALREEKRSVIRALDDRFFSHVDRNNQDMLSLKEDIGNLSTRLSEATEQRRLEIAKVQSDSLARAIYEEHEKATRAAFDSIKTETNLAIKALNDAIAAHLDNINKKLVEFSLHVEEMQSTVTIVEDLRSVVREGTISGPSLLTRMVKSEEDIRNINRWQEEQKSSASQNKQLRWAVVIAIIGNIISIVWALLHGGK